jgi:CheY-like chemotaxis protein
MMYEPGDYVCPTDLPRRFLCQVVGAESFECGSGRAQVLKLEPLQGPWPAGTCLIRVDRAVTPVPALNLSRRRGLSCLRAPESAEACCGRPRRRLSGESSQADPGSSSGSASSADAEHGEVTMNSLFEPRVRRLVADHFGVGFDDLPPGGRMASVAVAEPASIDSDRETLQPEPALDGIRVLLVDDDANTREAIAMVLAECGAQVVAVGCGADALQALKNQAPDVLVSDMAMPGMDGRSLLRRIRQLRACRGSIPAIALTAYASPEHRMKALLAGYQVFLPKPFDPTELITLVATLAGRTLGS